MGERAEVKPIEFRATQTVVLTWEWDDAPTAVPYPNAKPVRITEACLTYSWSHSGARWVGPNPHYVSAFGSKVRKDGKPTTMAQWNRETRQDERVPERARVYLPRELAAELIDRYRPTPSVAWNVSGTP